MGVGILLLLFFEEARFYVISTDIDSPTRFSVISDDIDDD